MSNAKQIDSCYHCGDACPSEPFVADDHHFCCQGCQTVYQMLKDTGLTTYYDLERSPGSQQSDGEDLSFLDMPEVIDSLLDFREGDVAKATFYIPTMHCSACIWLLERLGRIHPGVQRSEVNFIKKEAYITFRLDQLSLSELVIMLRDLGYPPDLYREQGKRKRASSNRTNLIKLGVAGFAFGNIMLFSFPEYLHINDGSLGSFKTLFSYLNLLLALPVLLYADTEYLRSAWKSLKHRYLTIDVPISLGILTLFTRSAMEIISGSGPGYFDSFAGLVFFLLIGKWYQGRTYEALAFDRDFKSYFPMAVKRITEGGEEHCLIQDIQPGDRLRILSRQIIPADAILVQGVAAVDYSFVSGESDVVRKQAGEPLFAGGRQMEGSIEIQVTKTVSQSYLTSLWNQDGMRQKETRMASLIDRTSRWFSVGILSVALLTLIFWLWKDSSVALDAFTAVLIIACPCALALATPFALGNAARLLGKMGFFVRNPQTLEQLAGVKAFVFDKTGTLTLQRSERLTFHGAILNEVQKQKIAALASQSTHPSSKVIAAGLAGGNMLVEAFQEFEGRGVQAIVSGTEVRLGSATFCGVEMGEASDRVYAAIDGRLLGYFDVYKPLRPGAGELISSLSQEGELHLLSGDNEGEEKRMSEIFPVEASLRFRQSPTDKQRYINRLEENGKPAAMFGDGLNDAGALKAATVGIAIADDVFSFSPACDVIMTAPLLPRFREVLIYTRYSVRTVRWAISISLVYNIIGLSFAVSAQLTPIVAAILMPLSSVTVVAFVSMVTYLLRPKYSGNEACEVPDQLKRVDAYAVEGL